MSVEFSTAELGRGGQQEVAMEEAVSTILSECCETGSLQRIRNL